jgi:hypothetical protein
MHVAFVKKKTRRLRLRLRLRRPLPVRLVVGLFLPGRLAFSGAFFVCLFYWL